MEFWEEYGRITNARRAYIKKQEALEQGRRAADKIGRQGKSVQRTSGIQGKIEENKRALEALQAKGGEFKPAAQLSAILCLSLLVSASSLKKLIQLFPQHFAQLGIQTL
jgi:hypothetical protein